MFLGRKNQYCENDYTIKCSLHIQCDLCQIAKAIFHRTRTRTKNFTIHLETQIPQIAKAVLRKKNGTGETKLPEFRLCYKATIMHDTGQKQKYRPMEQDRKPRNKPMNLWVPYF